MKNYTFEYRNLIPSDHSKIISQMPIWWGGRDLTSSVPKLFVDHFCNTSFVVETDGKLVGFLIGFMSPTQINEGFIHFVGVDPLYRKQSLGKTLYTKFFNECLLNHRSLVKCCTSPVNKGSIQFHTQMGFEILPGDGEVDGVPVTLDYNRPGDHKVLFAKKLINSK